LDVVEQRFDHVDEALSCRELSEQLFAHLRANRDGGVAAAGV
jgi:hypothetical protein